MIEILLVEDSPSDAGLMIEALAEHHIRNRVHTVHDGEEALKFLFKRGRWEYAPIPDLIFLDLNLPRKDGREVLQEIKKDSSLCTIPVIVMTTSAAECDVLNAYSNSATSYVVKPLDIETFLTTMRVLCNYWFETVKLPRIKP